MYTIYDVYWDTFLKETGVALAWEDYDKGLHKATQYHKNNYLDIADRVAKRIWELTPDHNPLVVIGNKFYDLETFTKFVKDYLKYEFCW